MINEILQFALLMSAVIYLTLGVHVLTKSWRKKINRLFFTFCLSLSLWALGYALMVNAETAFSANQWRIFSSLGWCFFYAHWFCFSLELIKYRKFGKIISLAVYLPAFWFFYQTILLDANEIFMRTLYGWVPLYPATLQQVLFMGYYLVLLFSAIILVYRWGKASAQVRYKEQANIICISIIISLILGATTDTILPLLGFVVFPMGIVFILIGVSGIWFAIIKYRMLGITNAFVADQVIAEVASPIFMLNMDLRVERVNRAARELVGKKEQELKGCRMDQILNLDNQIVSLLKTSPHFENEPWVMPTSEEPLNRDEVPKYYMVTATTMADEYGDAICKVLILNDMTEMKRAEDIIGQYSKNLEYEVERRTVDLEEANIRLQEEITSRKQNEKHARELLYFDDLTRLPNRLYFKEKATESVEEAKRENRKLAFLCMDLDDFKYINESLGHYTGDELLKLVGSLLTELLPDFCVVARNGGDEFNILVDSMGGEDVREAAKDVADSLLGAFRRPFCIGGKELFITASMGGAFFPEDGLEFIGLMKHADSALFEAKQMGKNTAVFSTEIIAERMGRMADLRNRMHQALENKEFSLHYQPQVDLKTARITGFEALIRWRESQGNFVSPSEFIPLAEENGLIIPIGYWVIETAAQKLFELNQKGFRGLTMAVNISVNQLKQSNFVERTQQILESVGVRPQQMEFEITERVGFKGLLDAEKALYALQKQGIKISIDDFGTDYSSFMNIKRLPVDKIKIAMEFVRGIEEDGKDAAIVQTMVEMSRNLNLQVIAEGAETRSQIDYLREICCQEVQGYYFYKPLPEKELERILEQNRSSGNTHG